MKRPLTSTDLTDAEEAGLAGMEPLTSMPAELGMQGFPSGGQMCIGDAGLGSLSMPGQEGFLSSVSSSTGGLEGHATFPDGAFNPGTVPWRKLPTCHGAMLLGGAPARRRSERLGSGARVGSALGGARGARAVRRASRAPWRHRTIVLISSELLSQILTHKQA